MKNIKFALATLVFVSSVTASAVCNHQSKGGRNADTVAQKATVTQTAAPTQIKGTK